MKTRQTEVVRNMTLTAMFTAVVILLQFVGSFIKFGTFSVSLVLLPIVVGAALCGPMAGMWLGLVFGVTVLLSGDAAFFLTYSVPGTIITVILKGMLCGLCAGLVYRALEKKNKILASVAAAIVCPIVNTGVFLCGCLIFFMDAVGTLAEDMNAYLYLIVGFVGGNFIFELLINSILSPVIVRVIGIGEKYFQEKRK